MSATVAVLCRQSFEARALVRRSYNRLYSLSSETLYDVHSSSNEVYFGMRSAEASEVAYGSLEVRKHH